MGGIGGNGHILFVIEVCVAGQKRVCSLADAVFAEDLEDLRGDALEHVGEAEVGRVGTVGCSDVFVAEEVVGRKEIDVPVGLHPFAYLGFGSGLLGGLEVFSPCVEVAAFATLGLHEDKRHVRVGGADDVYETVEVFMDHFG